MTKSEIFKKAHSIAKSTVSIVGNYAIAFSVALKEVYAELSEPKSFIEQVEALGFVEEEYGVLAGYHYLGSINVKHHKMMGRYEVEGKMFDESDLEEAIKLVKELIK